MLAIYCSFKSGLFSLSISSKYNSLMSVLIGRPMKRIDGLIIVFMLSIALQLRFSYIYCVCVGGGGGGSNPQPSHRRSEDCGFNFDHVVGSSLIRNNFLSLRLIRLSSKRFTFRDVLSLVFNSKSKQTQFGNAFRRANNLRFNRAALIRSVLWLRSGS